MYLHGYTNPKDIIFDFAKLFCTGNNTTPDDYNNNWKLIYPNIFANSTDSYPDFWSGSTSVSESTMDSFAAKFFKPSTQDELAEDRSALYRTLTDDPRIVVKCMGKQLKVWRKKVPLDVGSAAAGESTITVDLPNGAKLAPNGSIRVMIEGKKYSLYRVESITDVKVIEFYIEGNTSALTLPSSCANGRVIIDFEEDISEGKVFHPYYLQLQRPTTVRLDEDNAINGRTNYFYLTWKQGDKYDELAHVNPEISEGTITATWVNDTNYGIGDKIRIQDTILNKVRFFKCIQAINPSGVASGGAVPVITSSNATGIVLTFPTKLYTTPAGATEVTDGSDVISKFALTNTGTAIYDSVTKTITFTLDSPASNNDTIQLNEYEFYGDNNVTIPEFTLKYNFGSSKWELEVPTVVTPPTGGGTDVPHTAANVKPITGTYWKEFWEEVYVYNPEPAWLEYRMVQETKWSWYKCNSQTIQYVQDWLPIEYWLNIDGFTAVAVIMGDPGMSATDYLSSPAYFGQLEQIEGALETDDKGNFACFSGSDQNPQSRNEKADISGEIPRLKRFGDYTGTGTTDIMLTSSRSGRPFQGHKVGLFGMYEFKEQTFNGQSATTGKHSVTDIVVADVNENERGTLRNCLGVPKLGKEHGVELVADRYMANKEKTYIFLHINSLYTPFNTGNDVLIGIAIRTDN